VSNTLEPVVPKINLYRDAVNVYVLQWDSGETGLFDLGSGEVLEAMHAAGMPAPELVMHTDYRRDRTFGHYAHPGLPIAVGEDDVAYVERAEETWSELQVTHGYTDYHRFGMPRRNLSVAHGVSDGQLLPPGWKKPYVYAQRVGAHTPGSTAYLIVDEGKRYLVGGDIIQADGTLHSIFELQRNYNFMEGLHALRRTVGWPASGDIDAVLPAHGEPIVGKDKVMEAAQILLGRIADFWERWRLNWPDQPQGHVCDFEPVTPHLRGATNRIQYAIVDDDGAAVLFDTGTGYPEGFEDVLAQQGIKDVQYAIITHHHDDHVMGFEWLKARYGTLLATHECMVDVLAKPHAYALNCLHDKPLKVDVVLREGQPLQWRGYSIYPHYFPSQTDYHAVYFCEVDGQMVLFSGDALYWEPGAERIRPTDPDWRNRFDVDKGYLVGAPLLKKYQPRLLAAAHVHPWPITREACAAFEDNAQEFHDSLRALVGRRHPTLGIDPFFISIYPYKAPVKEKIHVEVRVDNPVDESVTIAMTPCLPEGVSARPEVLELDLGPKQHARVPLTLTVADGANITGRAIWTLRVIFEGEDLGEFCEGMLEGG